MAKRPEQPWVDSLAAQLRTLHRCAMCHKRCPIPCKLTASEFRQMQQAASDTIDGTNSDRPTSEA